MIRPTTEPTTLRVEIPGILAEPFVVRVTSRTTAATRLRDIAAELDRPPVVEARRIPRPEYDYLRIDSCPYCGRPHTHGAGPPGSPVGYGDGHRVAHCLGSNADPGYTLREVRPVVDLGEDL
ncbi:MAG: hypothetical protein WD960_11735 [Gemmatimonadota bacterium]